MDSVCLVCSAPNSTLHLDVDACRACSSFFKRTKLSGRVYPCRQGTHNCVVTKNDKFSCRRCRYDRCVELGMAYDGPIRQGKKSLKEDEEQCLVQSRTLNHNSLHAGVTKELYSSTTGPVVVKNTVCLVCSAPNNSLHFGVEACRACSEFFKRTQLSGRQYECSSGTCSCEVTRKKDKFMCKRCRYDKCAQVGMMHTTKECEENAEELTTNFLPSTSCESMLDRIGDAYQANIANRLCKELHSLRDSPHATRVSHATHELYASTPDLLLSVLHFTIDETWTFFHKIHPSLNELPFRDQMELYRKFLPKFTITDSHFRTWQIWASFDKYSMHSASLCLDNASPDSWLRPDEGGPTRNERIETSMAYIRDQMELVVPAFEKAHITDREVAALFAVLLCEMDVNSEVSEDIISLLDSIREEAFQNLQRYYREEMRLGDFSIRLGNLMTIAHAVTECSSHWRSFFRTQVTLFDLWSAETQLKELLL